MDVNKSWRLTFSPSFDMGFDRTVNGGNYLFGKGVNSANRLYKSLYSF